MFQEEEPEQALKRALDNALESSSPTGLQCYSKYGSPDGGRNAANDPRYGQPGVQNRGIASHSSDKNGANLLKIAPFLIAFLHFFLDDPGQVIAAWLLALWPFLSPFLRRQNNHHPTSIGRRQSKSNISKSDFFLRGCS
ncbi:hypothetical protein HUS70_03275 [Pandoraea nosoerga]|uniref:hypothetical protein n=1 Tax=Pandoraea nosoerga TaxID=2508296 RepID=UPI00124231AA|nr:hypothetical protein [Pandoraea nosoerga]MBN4664209.1 hypothetical protein [Pandoraea nosoerga]MBN4675382.1 hypothetical protein [Pandoraea nosoerga]MBN4679296.1 hypothetical protein [Pandoraea nosoerga]MBN4743706.1 hypothetical protein [Pandoraea nosoerga]